MVLDSSQAGAVGVDVSDRPYFQEIVAGRRWDVSDLLLEPVTGEPSFTIARGIRDSRGTLQGLVITIVDTPHLGRVFRLDQGGQGAFDIIDSLGRLVYRHPEIALLWEQRNLSGDPMVRLALAGQESTGTFNSVVDGQARMGAVAPIQSTGWAVRAGLPEAEINAGILQDLARDSALFLLVSRRPCRRTVGQPQYHDPCEPRESVRRGSRQRRRGATVRDHRPTRNGGTICGTEQNGGANPGS